MREVFDCALYNITCSICCCCNAANCWAESWIGIEETVPTFSSLRTKTEFCIPTLLALGDAGKNSFGSEDEADKATEGSTSSCPCGTLPDSMDDTKPCSSCLDSSNDTFWYPESRFVCCWLISSIRSKFTSSPRADKRTSSVRSPPSPRRSRKKSRNEIYPHHRNYIDNWGFLKQCVLILI